MGWQAAEHFWFFTRLVKSVSVTECAKFSSWVRDGGKKHKSYAAAFGIWWVICENWLKIDFRNDPRVRPPPNSDMIIKILTTSPGDTNSLFCTILSPGDHILPLVRN